MDLGLTLITLEAIKSTRTSFTHNFWVLKFYLDFSHFHSFSFLLFNVIKLDSYSITQKKNKEIIKKAKLAHHESKGAYLQEVINFTTWSPKMVSIHWVNFAE